MDKVRLLKDWKGLKKEESKLDHTDLTAIFTNLENRKRVLLRLMRQGTLEIDGVSIVFLYTKLSQETFQRRPDLR